MKKNKVLEGVVLSDKSNKTIVVLVSTRLPHQSYSKLTLKKKKYKVHDENNVAKAGNKVRIVESRPYSKDKHFRLLEVMK